MQKYLNIWKNLALQNKASIHEKTEKLIKHIDFLRKVFFFKTMKSILF